MFIRHHFDNFYIFNIAPRFIVLVFFVEKRLLSSKGGFICGMWYVNMLAIVWVDF